MDKGMKVFWDLFMEEADEIFTRATSRTVAGTQKRTKAAIANSPVDTGDFVGEWEGALNGPPGDPNRPDDPTRRATATRLNAVISQGQFGDFFMFQNTDDVGGLLEFGYSDQAPQGITRLAARQWRRQVRNAGRAAQRRINKRVIEQ